MPALSVGKIGSFRLGPWKGMNEKVSASNLPVGVAADLQNVLLDETPGTIVKRNGSRAMAALPSGLPPRDTYVFTKLDGTSYLLVSDGVSLYSCTDPSGASFYTLLITGLTTDGFMEFETAENKVWMSNGIDPVMSWDGSTLLKFDRTFTSTTNLTTVDTTHIIHAGLTSSDSYWVGMKLRFSVGANVGTVVTVTAYVEATKTLTFTPAVAGILAADRFAVGVVIPKGAALRFWDGHLFSGGTADNQAELRFSQLSDVDTGQVITLDNPLAWPAQNELALNVLDQEKLWGIAPILRDRVLVHKASGIWRVERDPLTLYRLELVSRSIGSRFPDTWAEKAGLLFFLGQDKDGFPEIYKTDMVDVTLVDPDGGIEPTLRGLQQPSAVQDSRIFTSTADFDSGTKSTEASTAAGAIGIGSALPGVTSGVSDDTALPDGTSGYHGLLGNVDWDGRWNAANGVTPVTDTPAWVSGGGTWNLSAGVVFITGLGATSPGGYASQTGVLRSDANAILSVKTRIWNGGGGIPAFFMQLSNGSKQCWLSIVSNAGDYTASGDATFRHNLAPFDISLVHTITMQLLTDGTFKVWVDGALWLTGTGYDSSTNNVLFGACYPSTAFNFGAVPAADPTLLYTSDATDFRRVNWAASSSTGVPNTIPVTGNFVFQYDFTRAPDALRNFAALGLFGVLKGRCGVTTATNVVQLASNIDMTAFSAGQTVNLRTQATGALITGGGARVIASVNAGAFTITLDPGVVTTDSTVAVYDDSNSIALESWTSDTSDFSSGNDGAGYLAFNNGAQPTSAIKRYMRIRVTITTADILGAPVFTGVYAGMLWLSPAVQLGAKITSWRTFLDTITTPAGTAQTIKIRRATVTTTPIESDWGAWAAIVNGNNIGVILADAGPPVTSRWVQIKVEQGPSAAGLLPTVDALVVNWGEGSTSVLPVRGIVHKKRYMVVAASAFAATNDFVLVCDRNDQWTKFRGLSLNAFVHYKGNLYGLDAAAATTRLLDVDGLLEDSGVAIDAYLVTREEDLGAQHLRKNIRWAYLHGDRVSAAWTLTTSYKRTGEAAFTGSGSFSMGTTGLDVRQGFPIGTVGKRIQRKYQNAVLGEAMAFTGETVYFDIRPLQPT